MVWGNIGLKKKGMVGLKGTEEGNEKKEQPFTCFLIDDDTDDQEIFMTVIEEINPGIACVTAGNGEEAIDKLSQQQFKPDLIFLDLNMPLMNGQQFLEATQNCRKEIPVIVLTTSSDQATIDATFSLGASDYITKPDKFSEWRNIIREKINNWIKYGGSYANSPESPNT